MWKQLTSLILLVLVFTVVAGVAWFVDYYSKIDYREPIIVEILPNNEEVVTSKGCFVGGCSGQICSDRQDIASTCEFREEYACYKTAKCERQAGGQCGWTETSELKMCLNNPSAL
jgi:eight-cysteine-cluster-containing protein